MLKNLNIPAYAYVVAAVVVVVLAITICIVVIARRKRSMRRAMARIKKIEKSLSARSAERKKESAAFVVEIKNVQIGGTAATRAVEKIVCKNNPPLSAQGMAEENALTAALFPLYAQEKAYPELYGNERVSAATEAVKAADSAFESERKAYNAALAAFNEQSATKSGKIVARMYKYSVPPSFPDPQGGSY